MRRSLRYAFILSAASAFSAAICFAEEPPVQPMMKEAIVLRVDGDLTVDPLGVPVDYQISTMLPQDLGASLQRSVRSWRFVPPQADGKATTRRMHLRVTLATEKNDGRHPIRIDSINFLTLDSQNAKTRDDPSTPLSIAFERGNVVRYPFAGTSSEVNADVLVYAHVTPEGRVDQTMVAQVALLNVTGRPDVLRWYAKIFADQAILDVKNFRFHVDVDRKWLEALKASDPDALTSAFTVRFPIEFAMRGSTAESGAAWQQEVRTSLQLPSWFKPDANCDWPGVADLIGDDDLHISPDCPQLTAPVIGTTL